MLNGKFYTGLPPKMVERPNSKVCNRQESHFFWPDDSQLDSAVETRVKRRNSLQLEKPQIKILDRKSSVQDDSNGVDTRQMFHKEFAKSSINFYDNLQQPANTNPRPRLLRGMRQEVTPKLTEIKPQREEKTRSLAPLEGNNIDRRQQAYSSKIQFYDYVNEDNSNPTQNNTRRPKMDMNDKREMELNSKNSPKLQVKHNVRSLSMDIETETPILITKKPLNDQMVTEKRRPVLFMPKKILKHQDYKRGTDYVDNYMDTEMRKLRLRSPGPQKKHVTYNEEAAEYAYYKDNEGFADERYDDHHHYHQKQQHVLPNMSTGSRSSQQQQHQRPYGETSRNGRDIQPLNNNKNIHYNHYTNNSRKILPKLSETEPRARYSDDTPAATYKEEAQQQSVPASAPSDPRKHLRSSLCFNGDALVVGARSSTPSATTLARRSSAGQRISVGLPD